MRFGILTCRTAFLLLIALSCLVSGALADIPRDTLDRLAQNPSTAAFAAAVRPVVSRFGHTGIRLEDSFLMLPSGPENLSERVPRQVRDVEAVVGTGR